MHLIQINLANWHLIARVFEVMFEQVEIAFVDFIDQMHRQIVKVILNRVRTFGAVAFGFIKPWNGFQIDRVGRFDLIQHILHAVVEAFRPEDLVIATTVHDKRRNVPGHCGPVNVWIHLAAPANGIAREQKETAEAGDNAGPLADFLRISPEKAQQFADTPYLYSD